LKFVFFIDEPEPGVNYITTFGKLMLGQDCCIVLINNNQTLTICNINKIILI